MARGQASVAGGMTGGTVLGKRRATRKAVVAMTPVAVQQAPRRRLMLSLDEAYDALGFSRWLFDQERTANRIHVVEVGGRKMVAYAELVRYVSALYEGAGVSLDGYEMAG